MIQRRSFLSGLGIAAASTFTPRLAYAASGTAKRLVFIIQRGAADALHMIPPMGDPAFASLRGQTLPSLEGAIPLDDLFSLHPSLGTVSDLMHKRQGFAVHAVASAYRDRSHFDGQNILESGGTRPYARESGWLNRLAGLLPQPQPIAIAPEVPLALGGPTPVSSYAPSRVASPNEDLLARVSRLYGDDPMLAPLWDQALATRALAEPDGQMRQGRLDAAESGRIAARLLVPEDGARLVMLETGGWDTHTGQVGRLNVQLNNLDALLAALVEGLGSTWNDTLVIVATEFGRTVRLNGTGGTDHGTGMAALFLGGGLNRTGVQADWPGLRESALYEGRDLAPTGKLESAIVDALAEHFAIARPRLAARLYPDQPSL